MADDRPLTPAEQGRLTLLRGLKMPTAAEDAEMKALAARPTATAGDAPLTSMEQQRLVTLRASTTRTPAEEAEMTALAARVPGVAPVAVGLPPSAAGVDPYLPAFLLTDGSIGTPALYRMRMEVWAIPIEGVRPEAHGGVTLMLGDGFAPLVTPSTLVQGYMPGPGDFLVIHPDGTQVIREKGRFGVEYVQSAEAPANARSAQDTAAAQKARDDAAAQKVREDAAAAQKVRDVAAQKARDEEAAAQKARDEEAAAQKARDEEAAARQDHTC